MIKVKFELQGSFKKSLFSQLYGEPKKRIDTVFENLIDSTGMSKELRKFIKLAGTMPGAM